VSRDGIDSLASTALLGTARATADLACAHTAGAVGFTDDDPALRLLSAAALEATFLAGATVPVPRPTGDVAPVDDRPVLPAAAAERLRGLLTVGSSLLDEWFAAAARFRAPHALVVDLLDKALVVGEQHRDAMVALAGPRGAWVAARNPRWAPLVVPAPSEDDVWLHGTAAPRRRWFEKLREHDPAAAVTRLTRTWSSENAATRQSLLEVLGRRTGGYDEALLETALDDRSSKVRETAVRLLRRLPESAFGRRMTQRVHDWARYDGATLTLTVPDPLDASAIRDGLGLRLGPALPTAAAHVVRSLAASAPMSAWCPPATTPNDVLAATVSDEFDTALRAGWNTAAAYHRNAEWAAALLRRDGTVGAHVAGSVPPDVLVTHLRAASGRTLLDADLLGALPAPWPLDVAQRVLTALYTAGAPKSRQFRALTELLAHRAPFELAELCADAATRTDDIDRLHRFSSAADTLTHRRILHEELS